jgi:flagellar biogenesis protein FliO
MNHFQKIICRCAISGVLLAGILMLPGIVLGQPFGQPAYGGSSAHQQNQFAQEYVQPDAGDRENRFAGDAFPPHSRFDPNVQPAELMVQAAPPSSNFNQDSPDEILGSASGMMSSFANTMQTQWQQGGWSKKMKSLFADADIGRMLGSLAIVLGGYFALVWVSRQFSPSAGRGVPQEVLEVLGQIPFGHQKNLQIVRLGSKLLLLINGPDGTHPIGEITDPNEVEYLSSLCPGRKRASGANAVRIASAAGANQAAHGQPISGQAIQNAAVPAVPAALQQAVANQAAAMPQQNAQVQNHLAAILQSLNGSSGTAAVFEA